MRRQFWPVCLLIFGATSGIARAEESPTEFELRPAFLEIVRAGNMPALQRFWQAHPSFLRPEKMGEALCEALTARDESFAKAILESTPDMEKQANIVNAVDRESRNAVLVATESSSPEMVTYLLKKGANPRQRTEYTTYSRPHANAVDLAFYRDNPKMLAELLRSAPGPFKSDGATYGLKILNTNDILLTALGAGNRELVKLALARGLDWKNSSLSWRIWETAAVGGDLENVKALRAAGISFEPKPGEGDSQTKISAIVSALRVDRPDMARVFVENGADVSALATGNGGHTSPLMEAVSRQDSSLVDFLLEHAARVDNDGMEFMEALPTAIRQGDVADARKLLARGAEMEFRPFFDATVKNDIPALEKMKNQVNGDDDWGETAYHFAAVMSEVRTLDWLQKAGARQIPDQYGETPLFWAVRSRNLPAVEWLLAHGARASASDAMGETPLHVAAMGGSAEMVKALLKAGADPNHPVFDAHNECPGFTRGSTPLHRAAVFGNVPALRALLEGGADPNLEADHGTYPLQAAAWNGQAEAVKVLLAHGARLDGGTPVLLCAAAGFQLRYDPNQWQPLPFPVQDKAATAAVLLAAGADKTTQGSTGENALMTALKPAVLRYTGSDDTIFGDPIRAPSAYWRTQSTGASRANLIEILVDGGLDVNSRLSSGYPGMRNVMPTALMRAAQNLDAEAVKVLLRKGANVNLEDGAGRTALDYALRRGENSDRLVDKPFSDDGMRGSENGTPLLLPDDSPAAGIVRQLTAKGARMGSGPLFRAVAWGASRLVREAVTQDPRLLQMTSKDFGRIDDAGYCVVNYSKNYSASALSVAQQYKHADLAKFLSDRGAAAAPVEKKPGQKD